MGDTCIYCIDNPELSSAPKLETTSGHLYTLDGRTYFKTFVVYCPKCLAVHNTEARL
jgi:hypothetical protein